MKQYLTLQNYICGALAVLLLAGCSIDEAETTRVEELTAVTREFIVPATGGEAAIQLYANGRVAIEQLLDTGDWAEISPSAFSGDQIVTVTLAENPSFRRMVKLRFLLDGGARADTVWVKQQGVVPTLECPAPYKSIKGSTLTTTQFEVNTNIPLDAFAITTSYANEPKGWIKSVQSEQGMLVVESSPNTSDKVCTAIVRMNYVDGWEEHFSTNLYITQSTKSDEFGRTASFADVRAMATTAGKAVDEDLLIEGVVISDFRSKNIELNPSIAHDKVDVSVNDRTAYLESLDGRYGFRIQFDKASENMLQRGTRLSLSLKGAIVTREENPERYTISSLIGENMIESTPGETIPEKSRRISELTDDDLYTFVSLQNTEFLCKEGSYANVYENYTLRSSVNSMVSGNSNRMDGWASLLVDDRGSSIYAPINMLCLWRRSGTGVPQGVGSTHGVIVHNQMLRYGNVGRYQIRVLDESGFAMNWTGESAYTTFAKWDGNPHQYRFSIYQGISTRYTYAKLASITPSDEISKAQPTPNAELFCENQTEMTAIDAWPISSGPNYNNLTADAIGMSSIYKSYYLKSQVKGWYRWSDGQVTGYNGMRMEFSTKNISGTRMLVGFSFAAGTISANTSKSYPAHWCVEYSIDGGQSYTLCPMSATGADYAHLRSLPWWDASLAGNRYNTSARAGIGLTDHAVFLPAEIFGKEQVAIRIRPYDKVMTVLALNWDGNNETAEVSNATTYDNRFYWGMITLRYL